MSPIREFSSGQGTNPVVRNIDNDAPPEMRREIVDVIFSIAESTQMGPQPRHIYNIACQSLGIETVGNPSGGLRHALGRDIAAVDWRRVFDLICRLWPDFSTQGFGPPYRERINRVLAGYGIAWDLDENGQLRRVLPPVAQAQVQSAIQELNAPRFQAAAHLFDLARDAYDDRPRRDRDACANAFDAMEAVAKVVFDRPNDTFGQLLRNAPQSSSLKPETIAALDAINTLRNRKFGHGTTFDLSPAETDFTYIACVGGILLFAR